MIAWVSKSTTQVSRTSVLPGLARASVAARRRRFPLHRRIRVIGHDDPLDLTHAREHGGDQLLVERAQGVELDLELRLRIALDQQLRDERERRAVGLL